MRELTIGCAQLGPTQRADSRAIAIDRLIALLEQAGKQGATLVVFPELALTTFFPRWYMEDQAEIDAWFEREMPNDATQPLFDRARELGIGMYLGYAELTPDGQHFNTSILTGTTGEIVLKYRKIHLPGRVEFDPDRAFQHLEKRYFLTGDLGFNVVRAHGGVMGMCICNDRRWPETYRVMGLQGVEVVMLGFNTPSLNSQNASEGLETRLFHHRLSCQSGAYQNSTWVIAAAKAGVEDGNPMFGCSLIADPDGNVVAEAQTEEDELLVHTCDLDRCTFAKQAIFDFARHRRIEHYGLITSQTGVIAPPE